MRRKKPTPARTPRPKKTLPPVFPCEAEVVEGLEAFARIEIEQTATKHKATIARVCQIVKPGVVRFGYVSDLRAFQSLQTVTAVNLVRYFAVPRPRALLGHEHFHALLGDIQLVRGLNPVGAFRTFHLDAAGSDSSVMQRLQTELASVTGLEADDEAGDLLIRLRRSLDSADGWETAIRLTPRPLSTRDWRECNYEGALNATVAHVMALLTRPSANDVFLNSACGSGTILIERLGCGQCRQVIGVDNSDAALDCAKINIVQARLQQNVTLLSGDIRQLPIAPGSVDALCADLPFGQLVGSHEENVTLYPRTLDEAARVARPGAGFVVISHEIRLMESLLRKTHTWIMEDVFPITLRGLHPRIFVLRRENR
jgi:tRNA (guanine6-N2)-methyltransferase